MPRTIGESATLFLLSLGTALSVWGARSGAVDRSPDAETIGYVKGLTGTVRLAGKSVATGRKSGPMDKRDVLMPVFADDSFQIEGDGSSLVVKFYAEKKPSKFDAKKPYAAPKNGPAPARPEPGPYFRETKRGGSSRKDPGGIVRPHDGSFVDPARAGLTWNPVEGPVSVRVLAAGDKTVFQAQANGPDGSLVAPGLQTALAKWAKKDTKVGLRVVLKWSGGEKSAAVRLLSSDSSETLKRRLVDIEKLEEPDRTLARIDAFAEAGLINDAADAAVALWEAHPDSAKAVDYALTFVEPTGDDVTIETLERCEKKLKDGGRTSADMRALLDIGTKLRDATTAAQGPWCRATGDKFRSVLADATTDEPVLTLFKGFSQMYLGLYDEEVSKNEVGILNAAADTLDEALALRQSDFALNVGLQQFEAQVKSTDAWGCDLTSVTFMLRAFAAESGEGAPGDYARTVERLRALSDPKPEFAPCVRAYYYYSLASGLQHLGKSDEAITACMSCFDNLIQDRVADPYIKAFALYAKFRILADSGEKYESAAVECLNAIATMEPGLMDKPAVEQFVARMKTRGPSPSSVPVDVPDELRRPAGHDAAIVIGTKTYRAGWEPLKNSVIEAEAVAERLEHDFGFKTLVLKDPTKDDVIKAIVKAFANLGPGRQLLIYVAGHGGSTKGGGPYLAFRDTPPPTEDYVPKDHYYLSGLLTVLKLKLGGQVLLVLDTCYSGDIVKSVSGLDKGLSRSDQTDSATVADLLAEPCGLFICAGHEAKEGPPGTLPPFAKAFLEGLKEKPGDRGFWKSSDVFGSILRAHTKGDLLFEPVQGSFGVGNGGFVFVPKRG